MEIINKKISTLKPSPYNPRVDLKPGDIEYEKLKKSILEFTCVEPIVWNKRSGNVVGGNQRLKILKELGYEETEVSVVDLDDAKEKALNLALNKIEGGWDYPILKDILIELDTGEFDIEITGFDEDEIEELLVDLDRGDKKEKNENLEDFKRTHILLSFKPELLTKMKPYLDEIVKINGIAYEQSSN